MIVVKVKLSQNGAKKILKRNYELYKNDFDQSLKSLTPGQWCAFEIEQKQKVFFGYINPHVQDNRPLAYIVTESIIEDPWSFIEKKLDVSLARRSNVFGYGDNARLVYGKQDSLPGLIVDGYRNCVFIQINTAGIDQFRENIQKYFERNFPAKEILFLDNESYRKGEGLPFYELENLKIDSIDVVENELNYSVRINKKQKIGYYYDHRINRVKAQQSLKFLQRKHLTALDLFCYIGSWGMNLLKSDVEHVTFVDQGDFEYEIQKNLKLNGFSEQGIFERSDVFGYLKQKKAKFDVICSDPPAFCKSKKEKQRAIDGYTKLHRLCLEHLEANGLLFACSCTHYVNHEEFQQSVINAARIANRKIQLIDIGMQGYDHPIESEYGQESYLKYYAYYVE